MKSKIIVLYHFYYPNDVVSARVFQELCEDLVTKGWDVEVWPCNRDYHNLSLSYPADETLNDVRIKRVWRLPLSQASSFGRIVNSLWMILAWSLRWIFYRGSRPQTVLIGTDPVLSLISAVMIRAVDSKVKIAHWCFDLYPEAAVADGRIKENGALHQFLMRWMEKAYQACSVIVDIGMCMRERLQKYPTQAVRETLTPWALYEPSSFQNPDLMERKALFGESRLGILYSGTFGLAHSAELTLKLAELLKQDNLSFCFSTRGNAKKDFHEKCVKSQSSIRFVDFVDDDKVSNRLEAADIHLVSLKENWTGTVVPSKFFAALAAGRPVLFEGSENSAIAGWIREYGLGWVLTPQTFEIVAEDLRTISKNLEELRRLQRHCREIYQSHFSHQIIAQKWGHLLSK